MALTLLAGPANAGKVALLLDRYLADIHREPVLIVPTGSDVERVERDLLGRAGALLGGSIGTFDDVFDGIAKGNGGSRPVAGDAQRALILRRAVARATLADLEEDPGVPLGALEALRPQRVRRPILQPHALAQPGQRLVGRRALHLHQGQHRPVRLLSV